MNFICLFFPALIASYDEMKSLDNNLAKLKVYCKNCLYINFIMIIIFIFMGKSSLHFDDLCTVRFYAFYLLMGIILSKLLPNVFKFCRDNFSIKIRRKDK